MAEQPGSPAQPPAPSPPPAPPAPPAPGSRDLEEQLADAERRAAWALSRVSEMHADLYRAQQWRRATVASVVAVALLAILMLGIVAFKAIDASADRETGAAGDQLMERVVFSQ